MLANVSDRRGFADMRQVVELDLLDAGLQTKWEDMSVPKVEWKGVRRPYWNVNVYRLPVCKYSS